MSLPTYQDIQRLAYQGVRLEITRGMPTWEAMPGALHNGVVNDIRQNLSPGIMPRMHPAVATISPLPTSSLRPVCCAGPISPSFVQSCLARTERLPVSSPVR